MTRGVGGSSPANVSSYLKGIDYPASRDQVATHAEENGADAQVLDIIRSMPDQQYENMADVMSGYGAAKGNA